MQAEFPAFLGKGCAYASTASDRMSRFPYPSQIPVILNLGAGRWFRSKSWRQEGP